MSLLADKPDSCDPDQSPIDKTSVEGELIDSPGFHSTGDSRHLSISESDILGSGKVISLLGFGGMARVYKIWNEKLEVFRAVKILNCGLSNLIQRFETECKITAKLNHPCIVKIYDVGNWYGLPYIEMEYIDGVTLEKLISTNGNLPDIVCSSIAIQIARALHYAHNEELMLYSNTYHGVIHRDLKPANVMLSSRGEIRLLDFGIARPSEINLHTTTGNFIGTLQYLSPEQIDGVDVDIRTDIYAMGAILYEMLTGSKIFPADTATALIKKKFTNNYKHLSQFNFHISSGLSKIINRCLQLDKNDRYPNAAELLSDLKTFHKSSTDATPSRAIRDYTSNTDEYTTSKTIHTFNKILLIPFFCLVIIGIILFIHLYFGSERTLPMIIQTSLNTDSSVIIDSFKQNDSIKMNKYLQFSPVQSIPARKVSNSLTPNKKNNFSSNNKRIDLLKIGKEALYKKSFGNAIIALEKIPDNHPEHKLIQLLLFEAYLEEGKVSNAVEISKLTEFNDAQFDLLCGKLACLSGDLRYGLECFQNALTKPSTVKELKEIRNDALVNIAETWSTLHHQEPSEDTRLQMLNAWNVLKKMYNFDTKNPLFIKAVTNIKNAN